MDGNVVWAIAESALYHSEDGGRSFVLDVATNEGHHLRTDTRDPGRVWYLHDFALRRYGREGLRRPLPRTAIIGVVSKKGDLARTLSRARVRASRKLMSTVLGSRSLCAALSVTRRTRVDGRVLDPQAAAMLALHDLDLGSDLRLLGPRAARHRLAEQVAIVSEATPPNVGTTDHAIPGSASTLPARLYEPAGLPHRAAGLVFFHGGGWVTGDLSTHDALCRRLAFEARCRVLAVAYRLAPEHRFPVPLEDALAATRWALANAATLDVDPDRVAIVGDSAGGNLSAVVSLRMRGDARRPALQVPLYPGTDATMSMPSHRSLGEDFFLTRASIEWYRDHYLGPDPSLRRHPDVSPLFADDVSGAPAAIVVTAGFDPLRDEATAYAERLSRAGVPTDLREVSTLPHGFALMCGALDAAREATTAIAREIGRRLGSGATA